MSESEVHDVDVRLGLYKFRLRDGWKGPGQYGFDVACSDLSEPIGEVRVDESGSVMLYEADVAIDSADPLNTFADQVVDGLLEVLLPHEPVLRHFADQHGEDNLSGVVARHVERLRGTLIHAIHTEMSGSQATA